MTIAELAAKYEQYVIDMRREFHENPELSHHEERTVRRIREELDKLGIPNITVGHNNVIGTLEGGKPGKKIAIRADIDALPVAEGDEAAKVFVGSQTGVQFFIVGCLIAMSYTLKKRTYI